MNKQLAGFINKMVEIDQDARFNADNKFIVYTVDAAHEMRINKIIRKYGYPNEELLGKESLKNFWLLVQHMDFDVELQESCLEKCGFAPKETAYLYDRVQIRKGFKQKYGTQFYRNKEGKTILRDIEDIENVDKRRKEMGMETLEEYKAFFYGQRKKSK